MRPDRYLIPLALATVAFIGHGAYTPGFAIAFAERHWNWNTASGAPAPCQRGSTVLNRTRAPGEGWFQPHYQCAEFVGRSLHAGGIPVPEVPESNPRWPVLVNVDRLSYFLLTRHDAHWIPLSQLRPGDMVLFRYKNPGHAASPAVWSHTGLVVGTHPVILDAHNAAHRHIPLSRLARGTYAVGALAIAQDTPPLPTQQAKPAEVQIAWRDLWTHRGVHLYWGQVFRVTSWQADRVHLDGVPGSVPQEAVAPLPMTPSITVHGVSLVVLGLTSNGHTLVATRRSPTPPWTGTPYMRQVQRTAPDFSESCPAPSK